MAGEGKSAVRASSDGKWVEEVEFRLIFVAAFIVFLAANVVSHLMPWRWGIRSSRRRQCIDHRTREGSLEHDHGFRIHGVIADFARPVRVECPS